MKIVEHGIMRDMTPDEIAEAQAEINKAITIEKHRPLTESEVMSMLVREQINTITVDDSTALRMIGFYPTFENTVGKTVKKGFKFTYGGKLWSVAQPEMTIQSHYPPSSGTESLYTEICEKHTGEVHDPIPYEGNMALENGKYYTQDDVLYLCNRDTGNPVYNSLVELVGLYVEIV